MNHVNVSTTKAEITITEENGAITSVVTQAAPSVITAYTQGPQGAPGDAIASIGQIPDVDIAEVTDGAVLYYDAPTSKFKANTTWTTSTLSDGGNF